MDARANTLENHLMPFTAYREFMNDPRILVRAEGVHYWDHQGRRLLDGVSGMFCCALGHGRTEIVDAIARQAAEMAYAPPFQHGNPRAFELARKVAGLTPGNLNRIFFGCSGSEAVDSAMKIILAYHRARGEPQRLRFVSRDKSYHGVNFGGLSLSGMRNNRLAFGAQVPGVVHMRHTLLPENKFIKGQPPVGAHLADDLQRFVDLYGAETIAAVFVEPIPGGVGCLVPPVGYLERLREICDANGILLVFDEVICGFGRTGKAFAAQSFGVQPDIITMAKAITNAAQPLGAVAVSETIHDTILNAAPEGTIELFHGYTYSGHPVACAAGIATLDIYERERTFEAGEDLSPYFLDAIFSLSDLSVVTDIRGYGLLAGIDLAADGAVGRRGVAALKALWKAGLLLKITGDAVLVAPPLVSSRQNIDEIRRILEEVLGAMK